jgi:hypothetical protein
MFVNGNPLALIGSLPIATNAEAVAGTDNTKVMTPLRTKESIIANAPGGSGAVGSVNGKTGVVVLNQDEVLDGTTYKQYPASDKTKLAGIASGATVNSTDAQLRDRSTHTGTQSADTITDGTTNKTFSAAEDTKLAGIATGATVNSSDATLLARANHTGTQAISTVTGLQAALDLKDNLLRTINTYSGTSLTAVAGDNGAYVRCTGSNPTYTIPPNSSVAFPVGTQIDGIGVTAMTIVAGAGVTINKARTLVTLGAKSGWTAIKVATDEWDVHGDFV